MKADIWAIASMNEKAWNRIVADWKKDRNNYISELCGEFNECADQVLIETAWPRDDGVFLLKEAGDCVEIAKKQLHPQMHKYLDQAVDQYGKSHVDEVAVLIKAIAEDCRKHQPNEAEQ
jgi:hypothetical protein